MINRRDFIKLIGATGALVLDPVQRLGHWGEKKSSRCSAIWRAI